MNDSVITNIVKAIIVVMIVFVSVILFMQVQPTYPICGQGQILDLNKSVSKENSTFLVVVAIKEQSQVIPVFAQQFYALHVGDDITVCENVGIIIPNVQSWSIP